jgi:hypothetical protein
MSIYNLKIVIFAFLVFHIIFIFFVFVFLDLLKILLPEGDEWPRFMFMEAIVYMTAKTNKFNSGLSLKKLN